MFRLKNADIIDDGNKIEYNKKGGVLGLNVTTNGIQTQATTRKAIAQNQLNKFQRFRDLSERNKLKLHKSLIISSLIYPTAPLNTISYTKMRQLQRFENKSLRFITNTSMIDRTPSRTLHERLNKKPINLINHEQARNTWEHMKNDLLQINGKITDQEPLRLRYISNQSSKDKVEGNTLLQSTYKSNYSPYSNTQDKTTNL